MHPYSSAPAANAPVARADGADAAQRAGLFTPYLSPAELAQVRQRMIAHDSDWHALTAQASERMRAGAAPHEAAVQDLARRWAALFRASYAGADAALDAKVRAAFAREPGLSAHIDVGLTLFMQQALVLLHRPLAAPAAARAPKPSAATTATLRAAHQLLDQPPILDDPLALAILGPAQEAELRADLGRHSNPLSNMLRATVAVRSRLAEDSWRLARRQGVRQCVILGAGLDTFAYRAPCAPDVRLFEVDLPATQQWKRACLQAARIAEPTGLRYVALDFAETGLEQGLCAAGFDAGLPAAFSWLGVSMYLGTDAVEQTLGFVAACAPGSSIVFDYMIAPALLGPAERAGVQMMEAGLAAQGEPILSHFAPDSLAQWLRDIGFGQVAPYTPQWLGERYLSGRADGLGLSNVFHMVGASV